MSAPGRGALAGGLVDRRRQPGPRRQVRRGGEPGHVGAGLGDDDLRDLLPDPGMVCSSSIWCAHGAHAASIAWSSSAMSRSTRSSRSRIDPASRAWWASKWPSNAWARSGIFARILPLAISASTSGSRLPVDHRRQDRPRRDRLQRRGHRGQLDRGVLEHQLQPHDLPGPVPDQLHPVAGQHPQPADLRRRHERRRQQPVLEQLRDPLRVPHIGLAPRHRLHVRGVEQPDLHHLLQAVERRLPVRRGRLHRRDRHPLSTSQSRITPSDPVVVLNVRVSCAGHAARPGVRTHTVTRALPIPAPRPGRRALPSRSTPSHRPTGPPARPGQASPGRSSAGIQTHVLAATIQRHPKTPRHTPQRAHPHQCVPTSPSDPRFSSPNTSGTEAARPDAAPSDPVFRV